MCAIKCYTNKSDVFVCWRVVKGLPKAGELCRLGMSKSRVKRKNWITLTIFLMPSTCAQHPGEVISLLESLEDNCCTMHWVRNWWIIYKGQSEMEMFEFWLQGCCSAMCSLIAGLYGSSSADSSAMAEWAGHLVPEAGGLEMGFGIASCVVCIKCTECTCTQTCCCWSEEKGQRRGRPGKLQWLLEIGRVYLTDAFFCAAMQVRVQVKKNGLPVCFNVYFWTRGRSIAAFPLSVWSA